MAMFRRPFGRLFQRALHQVSPLLILGFIVSLPAGAHAEFYISGYAGASFTMRSDIGARDDTSIAAVAAPTDFKLRDVSYDSSFMGGGKLGYWLDFFPYLGLEADVYHFNPDVPSQLVTTTGQYGIALCPQFPGLACPPNTPNIPPGTQVQLGTVQPGAPFTGNGFDRYSIGITAVGMNFMARLPLLRNERFANGRLQPYLGVGPAIFFTEVTFRPFGGNISPAGQATQTASATALGVQGVTGVKYFISPRFSVFAEYKFSHVETEVRSSISNGAARAETFKTSLDLTTHHAVGGIAFHFDAF